MPNIAVKLYSVFFKHHLKNQLQSLSEAHINSHSNPFGIISRPEDPQIPANPTFQNSVATKDIHIDPSSSLSLRIFLPDSVLCSETSTAYSGVNTQSDLGGQNSKFEVGFSIYGGYSPLSSLKRQKKLPVVLQFHGGGFVNGSNSSVANDAFCRRITKACDVIVVAVGYRLAPESRYPAAFEDGLKVLNWLGKQANLTLIRNVRNGTSHLPMFDGFGVSMAEPWLAAHGDPSRYPF